MTSSDQAPRSQPTVAMSALDETVDPLVGTMLLGKWRVLERLGAGSFGTVYKVEDVKGGWIEALKVLGVQPVLGRDATVPSQASQQHPVRRSKRPTRAADHRPVRSSQDSCDASGTA